MRLAVKLALWVAGLRHELLLEGEVFTRLLQKLGQGGPDRWPVAATRAVDGLRVEAEQLPMLLVERRMTRLQRRAPGARTHRALLDYRRARAAEQTK
jgi:hypothetical protein